jgi:iron uptake system component EfeO
MRIPLLVAALLAAPALSACTQNATTTTAKDDRAISVTSTDDGCDLSTGEAPSGTLTFDVSNDGSKVTEFYLYADGGDRIAGEVENVGPGLSRQLTLSAPAGSYVAACKPGMKGEGIRADFTVTDSGAKVAGASDDEQVQHAQKEYQAWVQAESDRLLAGTARFVKAYKAGDDKAARALYADTRTHWERIETVAESFGDLDPRMDAREADLEPGQRWTGWHRLEKDLWPARAERYASLTPQQRATYADALLADTRTLDRRIGDLDFTVDEIANGSRGLMEEVATGKVTGEEEYWSRTDLWDMQANVDGAKQAFEVLEPVLELKDPGLEQTLDQRFEALQGLLDAQRVGTGFTTYDRLPQEEIKRLADAVNALSEPLSHLTAAVLS